ncbi:hypothetical protein ABEB36_008916 [Hypothenemus hampei]|uniref:Uncharacterized protein n=1 Tax=Hypothenemus hampei TaxID=57062 RepID=A0ABD1ENI4_HYPHA
MIKNIFKFRLRDSKDDENTRITKDKSLSKQETQDNSDENIKVNDEYSEFQENASEEISFLDYAVEAEKLHHFELKDDEIESSISKTDNPQFRIVTTIHSTNEQISAIKFLFDNFVDEIDIQNVSNMSIKMTKLIQENGDLLKKCRNCHGWCKACKFCQCREQDIFLLNNAFAKIKYYNEMLSNFLKNSSRRNGRQIRSVKQIHLPKESLKIFEKLKRKLNNMKIFYPNVYKCEDDILLQWGQESFLTKMNLTLLNAKTFSIQSLI